MEAVNERTLYDGFYGKGEDDNGAGGGGGGRAESTNAERDLATRSD